MNKIYEKRGLKWINEYYDNEEYIILKISKPETKESYNILIDKDDFEKVSKGQWSVHNNRKNSHLKDIYNIVWSKKINGHQNNYNIYQLILDTKNKNIIVDHVNTNRLDNRKCNLRIVNAQINRINQESKGYCLRESGYITYIFYNDINIESSTYKTKEEALIKYIQANILLKRDKYSYNIQKLIDKYNIKLNLYDVECDLFLYRVNKLCDFYKNVQPKFNIEDKLYKKKINHGYNLINKGYYFEKKTGKYLVRVYYNGKEINMGRYINEKDAEIIYLKGMIILGNNKISNKIQERINKLHVILTEEDYNSKYIKKLISIIDGKYNDKEFNGKFNKGYEYNKELIIKLRDKGMSWNKISKYLVENNFMKLAKGETVKKYYNQWNL